MVVTREQWKDLRELAELLARTVKTAEGFMEENGKLQAALGEARVLICQKYCGGGHHYRGCTAIDALLKPEVELIPEG